ncbi:hypothetical protein COO60DRAFT_5507 [Scenedesmus sp. NREL 46B-D3]|nr:hypothetical protein COO60DRAFT_5507 [Scenedesmus sp. NREL 46B-D3]
MIGNLRIVAAEAVARAEVIAARQEVAVQSDDTQQMEWLQYVTSVPAVSTARQLHEKAVAETIVRIFIRALHQLEASWAHGLQQRQERPNSSRAVGSAGLDPAAVAAAAAAGLGGVVSTLFEAMMGHYSQQQQQQHGQQRAVQVYDASLWRDPQGPISRLLASCQSLTGSSTKVALFCRLLGTHRQPGRAAWSVEHWQHFLLVLHAAKRLIGGLWKGVLRDWASVAGARLPLQCVHDLLGNVYNVAHLAELDRLPALLNSKQLLLEQPTCGAVDAAREQPPRALQPSAEPGSGSSTGRSSREQGSAQAGRQQRGSVSAALRELLVDGPVGLAVDLDELLAMIMLQFDAGGAAAVLLFSSSRE